MNQTSTAILIWINIKLKKYKLINWFYSLSNVDQQLSILYSRNHSMWPTPLFRLSRSRLNWRPHCFRPMYRVIPFYLKIAFELKPRHSDKMSIDANSPLPTSQRLTFRSAPPVATKCSTGLHRTAFTSPSCASFVWWNEIFRKSYLVLVLTLQIYDTYEFHVNIFRQSIAIESGRFSCTR